VLHPTGHLSLCLDAAVLPAFWLLHLCKNKIRLLLKHNVVQCATNTLDHTNIILTYVIWCEEHLWDVCELQSIHLSNLVTTTTTTTTIVFLQTSRPVFAIDCKVTLTIFSHLLIFPSEQLTRHVPTEIQYTFLVPSSEVMAASSTLP
jgi:hypothetical protein